MDEMDIFLQKEATFALVENDVIIIVDVKDPPKIRACDKKMIDWFWKSFTVYFLRQ